MKTLLLFSLLFFGSVQGTNEVEVYICTGPKSECYHSKRDCRGLNKCSAEIKKITLEQAKKKG